MIYRVWASARGYTTSEWCSRRQSFWDEAVRGSSSLRAALVRAAMDEAAVSIGLTATGALLDIDGFYDNIQFH
eukprot:967392-Karenia_brevis.AAC.1